MFKLIRLAIFIMIAFVAGVMFERSAVSERCQQAGGDINSDGICQRERSE